MGGFRRWCSSTSGYGWVHPPGLLLVDVKKKVEGTPASPTLGVSEQARRDQSEVITSLAFYRRECYVVARGRKARSVSV